VKTVVNSEGSRRKRLLPSKSNIMESAWREGLR
jgi:hypothetical protein